MGSVIVCPSGRCPRGRIVGRIPQLLNLFLPVFENPARSTVCSTRDGPRGSWGTLTAPRAYAARQGAGAANTVVPMLLASVAT